METDVLLLILFYVFVIMFIGRIYLKERKKQKKEMEEHLKLFGSEKWDKKDAD